MLVTTKLEVNLHHPRLSDAVYAVQNDGNTRAVELLVFEGSTPWDIPPGTTAAVSFKKPDGTSGLYDVLPDGVTRAVTIAGNRITAVFAPQVLTCAGRVDVSVALYDRGLNRLGLFPFPLFVSKDPSANATPSEDYYTLGVAGMYVCSDGEYTAGGSPTIANPAVGTTYLVPQDDEGTRYASWVYEAGEWKFVEDLIVTFEETEGVKVPEKTAMATTLYGFYPYGKYRLSLYRDKATRDAALASGDHNTESMMPWADIESAFASGVVRLDIKSGKEDYDQSILTAKGTLLSYYPYADFNNMRMGLIIKDHINGYMDTIYPAVYED